MNKRVISILYGGEGGICTWKSWNKL